MSKNPLQEINDRMDTELGGAAPPSLGPALPGKGVQVIWGATADHYSLAGATPKDALALLKGPLAIPDGEDVSVVVNGTPVDLSSDTPLKEGDELEFTRRMGEKGRG